MSKSEVYAVHYQFDVVLSSIIGKRKATTTTAAARIWHKLCDFNGISFRNKVFNHLSH
jgi:hypothetical protein